VEGLQRRGLLLAIYEPTWFIRVVEYLKRRGVKFYYYYSSREVPLGSVVYTDYSVFVEELSSRSDLTVVYDPERNCRELERAILLTRLTDSYDVIIVGIDPGQDISYVIISGNELLLYGEGQLKDLERDLDYIVECIPHKSLKVKIGTGFNAVDTALSIKRKYNVLVELIDEKMSTPSVSRLDEVRFLEKRLSRLKPFRYKDIYAAYKIAISEGVEVL